jgi:hypothetical protein
MALDFVISLAVLAGIPICALLNSLVWLRMVQDTNKFLPPEGQFSYAWWFPKKQGLIREYRKHFPNGKLVLCHYLVVGIMGLLLFGIAISFLR